MELQKKLEEDAKHRKTMVSSGDRSAKIRTYNYPQGRVTEHRIGLTKYNLQNVMGGEIQEFIDELQLAENAERFNKKAKAVKCHQLIQGLKLKAMVFLIFVIVILVVLAMAGVFDPKNSDDSGTTKVSEAPAPARRLESWEIDWNY